MASKHYNGSNSYNELRIVMVGKTGIGKSASGNTILGRDSFESKFSAKSMTVDCSKSKAVVDGQQVAVIDTPGLFDTRFGMVKTAKDISQCVTYAAPGPHVFLVVIRLGRFTDEEKQTVQKIQEIFGQAADRYSMVLFTGGDLLKGAPIEEFLSGCPELQELVARCNGEYHVFNNELKDSSQVTELLQKIRELVQKNGGGYYTNEMFQKAEKAVKEEKQRILEEKAEQIKREKEQLERKLQDKFEKECQKIQKQFQEDKEKEVKKAEEERKIEMGLRESEKKREKEDREKERMERESEKKREKEERERERVERESEKKKEKEEREMERVEREYEKKREKEMMTKLKEKHERELADESSKLQSKFENAARAQAEDSNPFYNLLKAGKEIVVEGFENLVEKMSSLLK